MKKIDLNQIFSQIKNNDISVNEIIDFFKAVLDEIKNTKERLKAIEGLELLENGGKKVYNILENLLVSDNNSIIRYRAAKVLIHNFPNQSKNLLKWVFQNEKSIIVLAGIEKILSKGQREIDRILLFDLYQNLSRIYGLDLKEVKFLLELETILGKSKEIGYYHPNIEACQIISLQLGDSGIKKIPSSIGSLSNLKYLNLWNNKLSNLPESFENLKKLAQLYLDWNFFSQIPNISWNKLISLKKLSCTNNFKLKSLPESLLNLARENFALKYIKEGVDAPQAPTLALIEFLTGQKLEKIKDNIHLNKLYACNYKIDEGGFITGLFLYGYHSFQINFIPRQLVNFHNLRELVLRDQNLKFIPSWIWELRKLKKLDLMNNKIKYIPSTIKSLKHLTYLDLEGNQIDNIHKFKSENNLDLWI